MTADPDSRTGHRHSGAPSKPAGPVPAGAPDWWPLAACCLGTFLLLLYTSIVTVALPGIGAGLHAGFGARQWVIDVYTLALAGLLLGAGAVGDAYGTRRVYRAGVAGFTVATAAAGCAPAAGWLIAARAAQGVAGAAMFATIPALIGASYREPARRAVAFAVWGVVAGAASAVGTVSGGVLMQVLGWRWLFLGAVPLCLAACLLAARVLPRQPPVCRRSRAAARVDWPGTVLAGVSVTACAYAFITAGESGWTAPAALAGFAAAAVAGLGFALAERAAPVPVLPPALLADRRFAAVLLAAFAYYFAAFGALPGLATWMQVRLGLGSLPASLVLAVQLVVFVAASGLLSHRLRRRHPAWTLGGATALTGAGALAGTAVAGWPQWGALLPFLVLTGLGAGIVSPVLPAVALATAPPRHAGAVSSAANAARQLGLALGVAVCGVLSRSATGTSNASALALCGILAVAAGAAAAGLLRRA